MLKNIFRMLISIFSCFITTLAMGQQMMEKIPGKDSLSARKAYSRETGFIDSKGNIRNSKIDSAINQNTVKTIQKISGEVRKKLSPIDSGGYVRSHLNSYAKARQEYDSCGCFEVSKTFDSVGMDIKSAITPQRRSALQASLDKITKMKKQDLEKGVSKDDKNRISDIIKFTNIDINEQLLIQPYLYADSISPLVQSITRSNFSFQFNKNYLFSGYLQYRHTLQGDIADFWDFHIGYAGKVPRLSGRTKTALEQAESLHVLRQVLESTISNLDTALNKAQNAVVSGFSQELLDARQLIGNINADKITKSEYSDSSKLNCAKKLLESYELFTKDLAALQKRRDELQLLLDRCSGAKGNLISQADVMNMLSDKQAVLSQSNNKSVDGFKAAMLDDLNVKRFAVGRIYPYQSELTLKNTSLKGLDIAFEKGKWIVSLVAGIADFNLNVFLGRTSMQKPLAFSGVIYTGYKLNRDLTAGLRYFGGRKDNYAANVHRPMISGLSAELAANAKNYSISLELAKNISQPSFGGEGLEKKSFWNMSDYEDMAIAAKASFNIPRSKTYVNGSLAVQGKYYNAFNTLTSNIGTSKYDLKIRQEFWRGSIRLSGWLRNSEFTPALNGMTIQNEEYLRFLVMYISAYTNRSANICCSH